MPEREMRLIGLRQIGLAGTERASFDTRRNDLRRLARPLGGASKLGRSHRRPPLFAQRSVTARSWSDNCCVAATAGLRVAASRTTTSAPSRSVVTAPASLQMSIPAR